MATESILNNVIIHDNKNTMAFIRALEEAECISKNQPSLFDVSYREVHGDEIKEILGYK